MTDHQIAWKRIDLPGHEAARLRNHPDGWKLEGTSVFVSEALPVRLNYEIICDEAWQTLRAIVGGSVGDRDIDVDIEVHGSAWTLNGERVRGVENSLDIDLNFSPSTNLLPIRRLPLENETAIRAAWLRFPSFELESLEQTYQRIDSHTVRYTSSGGSFMRDLKIDDFGFVIDYPGIWSVVR